MSNIRKLRLDEIDILAGTQSRTGTNNDTVKEYKEALEEGVQFPPVIVFADGSAAGKWLADGFHRYHAHVAAKLVDIECDIRLGTLADAIMFSAGANGTHGLPRTNADKRNAVEMVLEMPQCEDWSDRQIARHCKVSNTFVGDVRRTICHPMTDEKAAVRTVTRNGVTYEQNTANIGKATAPADAAAKPRQTATEPSSTPRGDALPVATTRDDVPAPGPIEIITPGLEVGAGEGDEHDNFMQELAEENDRLQRALENANARVAEVEALLARNDLAAQVEHWRSNFEGISGRNAGLTKKLNEIEPEFEYQADLLQQIRKALGVERNRDILPALSARRAA